MLNESVLWLVNRESLNHLKSVLKLRPVSLLHHGIICKVS